VSLSVGLPNETCWVLGHVLGCLYILKNSAIKCQVRVNFTVVDSAHSVYILWAFYLPQAI